MLNSSSGLVNATLCASIGCFVGLLVTLVWRSGGIKRAALDALLGISGGLLMAWFISPISEGANDPDSLNIAAIVAASLGAFVFVTVVKAIRGK